jgi:integrase
MDKRSITTKEQPGAISSQVYIGQAANQAAAANLFDDYMERKAGNTRARYIQALNGFGIFLNTLGYKNHGMTNPQDWEGITFGLIEAYKRAQLQESYSIPTTNQNTYIIKAFAKLAAQAEIIPAEEIIKVQTVKGYKSSEAAHINEQRTQAGKATRIGNKKERSTAITREQAKALKAQPADTLQGKRNALLMALLLDHGARISEVISLKGDDFDILNKTVVFHRTKTNRIDKHIMTADSFKAAKVYFDEVKPEPGRSIWIGINKGGKESGTFGKLAAQKTVTSLGRAIGIEISCHDCRHYYATAAHRAGSSSIDIMRAGGWSSPAMLSRYIEAEQVQNINIRLE